MTASGPDRGTPVVLGLDFGGTKIAAAVVRPQRAPPGHRHRGERPRPGRARVVPQGRVGRPRAARQRGPREQSRRGRSVHLRDPLRRPGRAGAHHPRVELAGVRAAAARGVPRGPGQRSDGREGGGGGRGALGLARRLRPGPVRQPGHGSGGSARRRRAGRHRQPRRGRRDRVQPAPAHRRRAARPRDRILLEDRVSGLALSRQATRAAGRPMRAADVFATHARRPGHRHGAAGVRRRALLPRGQPGHRPRPGAGLGRRRHGPLLGRDRHGAASRRSTPRRRTRRSWSSRRSRTTRRCSARSRSGSTRPRPGHGRTTTSRPWPTAGCRTCGRQRGCRPTWGRRAKGSHDEAHDQAHAGSRRRRCRPGAGGRVHVLLGREGRLVREREDRRRRHDLQRQRRAVDLRLQPVQPLGQHAVAWASSTSRWCSSTRSRAARRRPGWRPSSSGRRTTSRSRSRSAAA